MEALIQIIAFSVISFLIFRMFGSKSDSPDYAQMREDREDLNAYKQKWEDIEVFERYCDRQRRKELREKKVEAFIKKVEAEKAKLTGSPYDQFYELIRWGQPDAPRYECEYEPIETYQVYSMKTAKYIDNRKEKLAAEYAEYKKELSDEQKEKNNLQST